MYVSLYLTPAQFTRAHDAKQRFLTSDSNCTRNKTGSRSLLLCCAHDSRFDLREGAYRDQLNLESYRKLGYRPAHFRTRISVIATSRFGNKITESNIVNPNPVTQRATVAKPLRPAQYDA